MLGQLLESRQSACQAGKKHRLSSRRDEVTGGDKRQTRSRWLAGRGRMPSKGHWISATTMDDAVDGLSSPVHDVAEGDP